MRLGVATLRAAALAVSAVVLAGCSLQPDVAQRVGSGSGGGAGQAAPALQGTTLDGAHFDGSALKRHVAVVDFWASWCGPCRAQQDQLDRLARTYAPRGVTFVGVDIRDDRAQGLAYVSRFGLPYPSLDDPSSALAGQWDVAAPPTTVVLAADGTVQQRVLGGVDAATIGALLDRLLSGH